MVSHDPPGEAGRKVPSGLEAEACRNRAGGPDGVGEAPGVAGAAEAPDRPGERGGEVAVEPSRLERPEAAVMRHVQGRQAGAVAGGVGEEAVAVSPVEVGGAEGPVEDAGEPGRLEPVAEVTVGVVVTGEAGRVEPDAQRVDPPEREVAGPQALENGDLALVDPPARLLVVLGIEPRGDATAPRVVGDRHVAEDGESAAAGMPGGVGAGEARSGQDVVVDEEDNLARRESDTGVEGAVLVPERDREVAQAGLGAGEGLEQGAGAVGAGVRDDDELAAARIVEDRLDESGQEGTALVGGDDDRDRRRALVFIAWGAVAGRSAEIAGALGGEAVSLFPPGPQRRPSVGWRYLRSAVATASELARRRPDAVIVTNPPVFAGLVTYACAKLFGCSVALDSHPGGFGAQGDRVAAKLQWLHRFLARRVSVSLVADRSWAEIVESWGGRAVVVHEAPMFAPMARRARHLRLRVLYVGRFAADEPVREVVEAARLLEECDVSITGDLACCPPGLVEGAPENVRFVGFLDASAYRQAIEACDVVLSLTTEPGSVMRAAYEATYAERPLVVSDWPVGREIFPYAVHVSNDAASIAAGLRAVSERYGELVASTVTARSVQLARWQHQEELLRSELAARRR